MALALFEFVAVVSGGRILFVVHLIVFALVTYGILVIAILAAIVVVFFRAFLFRHNYHLAFVSSIG